MVNIANTYTRIQNRALLYDYDVLNQQVLLRIRITTNENGTELTTPITPLYEARFVDVENFRAIAARPQELEPRNVLTCFANPDETAEYTRIVYIPYAPNLPQHREHILEVLSYPNLLALEYKGEVYNSHYEVLL